MESTKWPPVQPWPDFLDHLKAKSADAKGYQQTLAEHTWGVLERLSDQHRLRCDIRQHADDRLWHRLYLGCFLHDFGKAAIEFQERLRPVPPDNEWKAGRHRHEVLSLAFVDWLTPRGHQDRDAVLCIIVAHHKDFSQVLEKYGAGRRQDAQQRRIDWLSGQIDRENQQLLWRWMSTCLRPWQAELGFDGEYESDLADFSVRNGQHIANALDDCSDYLLRYDDLFPDHTDLYRDLLQRGLILTVDHAASAGTGSFPGFPLDRVVVEASMQGWTLKDHQTAAATSAPGSTILEAPTGSGKTEAAILWAIQQAEQRPTARLFYTLPYQASMNAMRDRLAVDFLGCTLDGVRRGDCRLLTIQHGRARLKHYQDYMRLDEADRKEAARVAKEMRNLAGLHLFPIQVFSPYQMLKAAYSLKGYEAMLVDYADALFIFDEIHAYDPKRLALILTFIAWLRRHLGARFFVMTATLPPPLLDRLAQALGVEAQTRISASDKDYRDSQRHVVKLLDGAMDGTILSRVEAAIADNQAVLICANRVADAQAIYDLLRLSLGLRADYEGEDRQPVSIENVEIVLLHGSFNGQDRARKEQIMLERAGVRCRKDGPIKPFICVATQVVEVSLNVDFDTIYSDPAPLEALLQRFGRVNRGRKRAEDQPPLLCHVHVFRLPTGSKDDELPSYLPYDEAMVQASVAVLDKFCADRVIDEQQVTELLGKIYAGDIRRQWEADYDDAAREFTEAILESMCPCESADREMMGKFFEMFDGIQVLPKSLANDFYDAMDEGGYLEATRFLVNISMRQYAEFDGYGLIKKVRDEDGEIADHIDVAYDSERGLDLAGAREEARRNEDWRI